MNAPQNYGGESVRLGQHLIELREIARKEPIVVANHNSDYRENARQLAEAQAVELGDDLPYTTGQIWAACAVLAVVLLAVVFGGAWVGVR